MRDQMTSTPATTRKWTTLTSRLLAVQSEYGVHRPAVEAKALHRQQALHIPLAEYGSIARAGALVGTRTRSDDPSMRVLLPRAWEG